MQEFVLKAIELINKEGWCNENVHEKTTACKNCPLSVNNFCEQLDSYEKVVAYCVHFLGLMTILEEEKEK